MEKELFERAFSILFFLMLSADNIADLKELKTGNKIIDLEGFDKSNVMNELDHLSSMSHEDIYNDGISTLKLLDKPTQMKCLAFIKIIAKVDGSFDKSESKLLDKLYSEELEIDVNRLDNLEKELSIVLSKI